MTFLQLHGVEKTYPDGTRAVLGVNLTIQEGEFIVLLGPSGCGKTTTLRMIAGLEIATRGRITLDSVDITALRPSQRDVGMVFQFYALYPHLTVKENIAFPLRSAGVPSAEVSSRVAEVATRMNLDSLLSRYPKQLAGGDQQRVSLARAIVRHPKLYLMDEPLGTVDADRRAGLRELIRSKQLEQKVTTLYVTHDQEEAMSLADRVVVMSAGEVRQVGTPQEVYDQPADLFVANFVGSPGMNFIDGTVDGSGTRFTTESGADLALSAPVAPGKAVLGIRSEYLTLSDDGPLFGRVALQEYLGSCSSVHIDSEFGRLVVRAPVDLKLRNGQAVRVTPNPNHFNLFNPDTEQRL